jgi:Protein of unknown function (DUF3187)
MGRFALLALILGFYVGICRAEAPWPDPGPPSTRDLFPLDLPLLTYRPVGAMPVGEGEWRVSLQAARENTFEFSDSIKDRMTRDAQGRIMPTRVGAERLAQEMSSEPMIFFFDGEVQRTELSARYGLTKNTDLMLTLAWDTWDGGYLDSLIEGFHKLGFEQIGRDIIAKNQFTLLSVQNGQIVFFTQDSLKAKAADPVIGINHRLLETDQLTVSLLGALQLPMTKMFGVFRSDWNSSAALLAQWRPDSNQAFNGGFAYVRRGLQDYGNEPFFVKDQVAGHLGWEWQGWSRFRPFFLLVYQSDLTGPMLGTHFDKPSLIHDLGVHVRLGNRTALTFSYINNITHNENTADMGFAVRLVVRP